VNIKYNYNVAYATSKTSICSTQCDPKTHKNPLQGDLRTQVTQQQFHTLYQAANAEQAAWAAAVNRWNDTKLDTPQAIGSACGKVRANVCYFLTFVISQH
jgi:hypothetical protein